MNAFYIRFFFIVLTGWSVVSIAGGSDAFSGNNIDVEMTISDENDRSFLQSKTEFSEGDNKIEIDGSMKTKNTRNDYKEYLSGALSLDNLDGRQSDKSIDSGRLSEKSQRSDDVVGWENSLRKNGSLSSGGSRYRADNEIESSMSAKKLYSGYHIFDNFHEEIKSNLNEDIYQRMFWVYGEVKEFDQWINSTISQLGFGSVSLFDNDLNYLLLLQQGKNAGPFYESSENGSWQEKGIELVSEMEGQANGLMADSIRYSKFVVLLNYLNIINIVYCFFIIFFMVTALKLLKFFVRRKKWS